MFVRSIINNSTKSRINNRTEDRINDRSESCAEDRIIDRMESCAEDRNESRVQLAHSFLNYPYKCTYNKMTSYGLCCFRKTLGHETEVLLLRRRYTYHYCMFVYSKYTTIEDLRKVLAGTTIDEKLTIISGDFDRIWDKIWVGHRTERYTKYRTMYENIMKSITLPEIIKIVGKSASSEPHWELPKGRKDPLETDIECACREFTEETTVARQLFRVDIDNNTRCYLHDYGMLYTMKFWAAEIKDTLLEPMISLENKSHHEHDLMRFIPVSDILRYLPEPMAKAVKALHCRKKKQKRY